MVQRKTNKGQVIDMDALMASQGGRPAIGNSGTDAHGNLLGANGEIIQSKEERARAYYQDNLMSSTAQQSLKGTQQQTLVPTGKDNLQEVKTAATAKENIRTSQAKPDTQKQAQDLNPTSPEGETFDDAQPLGFKEVEQPNGDIEMVPYYTEDDADEGKSI